MFEGRNQTSITWKVRALDDLTPVDIFYEIRNINNSLMAACYSTLCTASNLAPGHSYTVASIACFNSFKDGKLANEKDNRQRICSENSGYADFHTSPSGKPVKLH